MISAGPGAFPEEFYQTLKKINTNFIQKHPENRTERNSFHLILQGQDYSDTKPDKDNATNENHSQISLMNLDTKILNKIFPNRINNV